MTLARIREFLREPEVIFWVFVFPVLLAFALGIAFRNTAPEKVRIAVEDSQTAVTENQFLVSALSNSSDIEVVRLSPEEAVKALRSGKVAMLVRPDSNAANQPVFNFRFDPTRPESRIARLLVDDALQSASGRSDIVKVSEEKISEPGARYIDFLIPGLLGLNLMGSGLWGVGFAIVTARMRKLLKRLAATPMRRVDYLLSFVISRAIFLTLEVAAVLTFARLVFGFRIQGSMSAMAVLLAIGALTFSGIGLLVAARPETIEGVSGLMNVVMMPMWLFSGTFFSSSRFPGFLQPIIKALPLTALNDSLRSVMNDGAGLFTTLPAILVLLVWCALSFGLALKLFRWQ